MWWQALLKLLAGLVQYFANKQLLDAGAAKTQVERVKEVQANVAKAEQAVSTPDPERTERLRSKFDRSRRS